MNNKELQACRKLLMLDVSEAAEFVGGVSARTWQYWESGRSPVPQDVDDAMRDLLAQRLELMEEVDRRLLESEALVLPYFASFDEYLEHTPAGNHLAWRLQQSVAALYFTEGHAALA